MLQNLISKNENLKKKNFSPKFLANKRLKQI